MSSPSQPSSSRSPPQPPSSRSPSQLSSSSSPSQPASSKRKASSQTPSSSNKRVYNKSEGRTPRVKRGNAFDFGSFKVDLERLQSDAKIQDLKLAFYERDKPLPYWFISNDAMTASAKKLGIAREVLQGNCRLMFDLQVVVIADSIEQKLASSEEWVDTLANMITYLEFTVMRSDSFLDSRHDTVKCVSVAHGMDRTRSLK